MTNSTHSVGAELPEPVRAEAAVWLALLHSDTRSAEVEQGFRVWLSAHPSHALAFERMTNAWEAAGGVRRAAIDAIAKRAQRSEDRLEPKPRRRIALAVAASLAGCALVGLGALVLRPSTDQVISTALGERRSVQLADGSRLVLNTDTLVSVSFDAAKRSVTLRRGQARFYVARDSQRPFIVRAGMKQIVARGTQFDVRWTDERLAIVLFEGKVSVQTPQPLLLDGGIPLEPGERLYFAEPTLAVKSTPDLQREQAWVQGRAIFDRTPLREVLAEMNRYARRPLKLGDPTLAELPISGTFSVEDSEAFARALGDVFALRLEQSEDSIVLKRSCHAQACATG